MIDDARERIAELELRIEELAEAAERCRKIMLVARLVIALGAAVLLAIMVGLVRFDPAAMVGGIAAVLGGIVAFGSNKSTRDGTMAAIASAEALRSELIGRIDLRAVEGLPSVS